MQGNSLLAIANPNTIPLVGSYEGVPIKDEQLRIIKIKYPERTCLLDCILDNESKYCDPDWMIGDSGKAVGCFQIWISVHPLTRAQAMDFETALDYTAKMIDNGKGGLWTPYDKCLAQCKGRELTFLGGIQK